MTTTTGSFGTPLQGTLASNATDTIKLSASAAGAVGIQFIHPAGPGTMGAEFRLQLIDGLGNILVDGSANGNLALVTTVAAAGDYYLKVIDPTSNGSGPGAYTVTANLSSRADSTYDGGSNDSTVNAIATAPGVPIIGSLMSRDVDVFKLAVVAGGVVTLDFQHPDGAGKAGNQVAIELLDATGNLVIRTNTPGSTVLKTTVAVAGDYYVRILDGDNYQFGDGGIYTLTPTLASIAGTTYDGAANNATTSAIAGAFGSAIVGSLNSSDSDVFKLRADAGGVVTLDFVHPDGVGKAGNQIAIELLDAAGNLVTRTNTPGSTVLKTTIAAAGDYYVRILDGDNYQFDDGGIYTLTPTLTSVAGTTYDGAANNATASAIAGAFGTPIVGSLNSADTDFFKLRADAGGVVSLDFTHPDGAGTQGNQIAIELLDAAGNLVIRTNTAGSTVLTTTVAAAGDYYVRVLDGDNYQYGDGGVYQLLATMSGAANTVYDGAANNSSATALKATVGEAIVGSINSADSDFFSFSTASAGTLSLNVNHPGGAGKSGAAIGVAVLDANGATVFSKNLAGSELLSAALPSAGDYTLRISDGNLYGYDDGGLYTLMAGVASHGGSTRTGSAVSEQFSGSSGNDVINGDGGFDTVNYLGNAANYRIAISAAGVSVVDTTGKDGNDVLFNVERLQFADRTVSLETQGIAAQAYRVYQAAFDRAPDAGGLGFWIGNMENGAGLASVAQAFIDSEEFRETYGTQPSHRDMAAKFYTNVLHRTPDDAGLDFWVQALDSGVIDAAGVLVGFSESAENIAQLTGVISQGIAYLPLG